MDVGMAHGGWMRLRNVKVGRRFTEDWPAGVWGLGEYVVYIHSHEAWGISIFTKSPGTENVSKQIGQPAHGTQSLWSRSPVFYMLALASSGFRF